MTPILALIRPQTASEMLRRRELFEAAVLAGATFGALIVGRLALQSVHAAFSVAAVFYLVGMAAIIAKPLMGVYLIVFFTIVGDPQSANWYPFDKGGSAAESILFVNDKLVVTPYEGYIAVTVLAALLHRFRSGQPIRIRTPFTTPLVVFSLVIMFGVAWGVANGGVASIAINQTRFIIMMPVVFLVMVNLLDQRSTRVAMWLMLVAITLESINALYYLFSVAPESTRTAVLELGASPTSHAAAIQMNVLLFSLATVILLKNQSLLMRIALPFMAMPVAVTYVIAERRASVGALAIAGAILMWVLKRRQPQRFWAIAPVVMVVALGYGAAFWNSTSSAAFPVQAVKSQLVSEVDTSDASSDEYRVAENFNLLFTIKTSPVVGSGFGQPFLTPWPLPDISETFPFWNFFPHNSTLYLWSSGGILAIWTWLFIVFTGVREATKNVLAAHDRDHVFLSTVALATIVMVAIYNFLDISWDSQTNLLAVFALAITASMPGWIAQDEAQRTEASADATPQRRDLRR